ncbi:hypothetical protein [Paenibacillus elgii]|uniref:hypothetical protein n=1 Tax=Paenibacillus elgii TaxID=189691 RepID=UPI00167A0ED2|nr:hypothetical protein [Paenibacillus elgii]
MLSKLAGAGLGIAAGFAYMWMKSDFDAFKPFEALQPDAAPCGRMNSTVNTPGK